MSELETVERDGTPPRKLGQTRKHHKINACIEQGVEERQQKVRDEAEVLGASIYGWIAATPNELMDSVAAQVWAGKRIGLRGAAQYLKWQTTQRRQRHT